MRVWGGVRRAANAYGDRKPWSRQRTAVVVSTTCGYAVQSAAGEWTASIRSYT